MIPYIIQYANPSNDNRIENIDTIYGSSEKDKMNEKIIDFIINVMYDYCNDIDGYNFKITSYDEFCHIYWKVHEVKIKDWYFIFTIYYFENEWIKWNILDYIEEIYISYINKYGF